MERRSTNDIGHAHFQGDVVSNVGSSHGVILRGGSTGCIIEPIGDDTSISLTVRAKNAGLINLGNSTQRLNLNSTDVRFSSGTVMQMGSTAPWAGFVRYLDTAVTTPATFNDTECGRVAETTHVLVGASSITAGAIGYFIMANSVNLPAGVSVAGAWIGSTGDDVHVRFVKGSTVAVAGTTCTVQFLLNRF